MANAQRKSEQGALDLGLSIRTAIGSSPSPGYGKIPKEKSFIRNEIEDKRYRTSKKLGEGGMGSVYLAFDTDLNREIALKIGHLPAEFVAEGQSTILAEARKTGRLEHPNIVPVHAIGSTQEGDLYYTMRFVQGRSLAEVLKSLSLRNKQDEKNFTLTRLTQILQQVCCLHQVVVLHWPKRIHFPL